MEEKNIHQGHRKRALEKVLKYPEAFSDHELLEVLLFYALPRIDTNKLAHKLVRMFGSLDKVFSAPIESLVSVEGIGEKTATFIILVGQIIKRAKKQKENLKPITSLEGLKQIIHVDFNGLTTEKCGFYLFDKEFKLKNKIFYIKS